MPLDSSDKAAQKPSETPRKKKYAMDGVNLLLAQHLIDVEMYTQQYPETGISSEAMSVVTSFINDCYKRIAAGASRSGTHCNKRSTYPSKEVQKTVRALMTDEPTKQVIRKRARAAAKQSDAEVINKAVREMSESSRNGSSLEAIRTYIGAQYKIDAEFLAPIAPASEVGGTGDKSNASEGGAKRKTSAAAASGPPAKRAKTAASDV